MAKYSTGGGSARDGAGACELCGAESDDLRTATVAGARLSVCHDCAPLDENEDASNPDTRHEDDDPQQRRRRAAQNTAQISDARRGDPSRWEDEGVDYEDDRLPYLVRDYGKRVQRARRDAGLQREELAAELDVDENVLLAVEQGRATQADVGGSVITALEARLDVTLADE